MKVAVFVVQYLKDTFLPDSFIFYRSF